MRLDPRPAGRGEPKRGPIGKESIVTSVPLVTQPNCVVRHPNRHRQHAPGRGDEFDVALIRRNLEERLRADEPIGVLEDFDISDSPHPESREFMLGEDQPEPASAHHRGLVERDVVERNACFEPERERQHHCSDAPHPAGVLGGY